MISYFHLNELMQSGIRESWIMALAVVCYLVFNADLTD